MLHNIISTKWEHTFSWYIKENENTTVFNQGPQKLWGEEGIHLPMNYIAINAKPEWHVFNPSEAALLQLKLWNTLYTIKARLYKFCDNKNIVHSYTITFLFSERRSIYNKIKDVLGDIIKPNLWIIHFVFVSRHLSTPPRNLFNLSLSILLYVLFDLSPSILFYKSI